MLSRARSSLAAAALAAGLVVAGAWQIAAPQPARAGVTCPPGYHPGSPDPVTHVVTCVIDVVVTPTSAPTTPGKGGGGGGGTQGCTSVVVGPVPCYWWPDGSSSGWWDSAIDCWVGTPATSVTPPPKVGWFYDTECPGPGWSLSNPTALTVGGSIYLVNPPPNQPQPADVAKQAEAKITMLGPTIGTAPTLGGSGLVGMPVWLWTAQTPQTWGKQSQTAAVPGLSVTATATATSITWDMGDGHQVPCPNPGTVYAPSYGGSPSPTCGYVYTQPSGGKPNGEYKITATTTWQVTWVASTGQTGTLPAVTVGSTSTVKIGELQAVNH